jgi:beta-phosphoglucomutase family hydrolase
MTKPPAFIFDMDGTLVDNALFHTRAWRQFLAELGIEISLEQFHRQTSGRTNEQILHQFLGDDLPGTILAEYAERKESLYRALYSPHLCLVHGLHRFLAQAWHMGIPMAVATAADQRNIEFVMTGLDIKPYFRAIIGAEEVTQGKPHPEMFLTAAKRLDTPPEQCLVFEDSLHGIEAARRAGMKAIAVATTLKPCEFHGMPHILQVIENFDSSRPEIIQEILL